MSMHLEGPWLSTTSSKKRKVTKFKSAEHKARYLKEQEEWAKMLKKYAPNPKIKDNGKPHITLEAKSYRRETPHIPSLDPTNMAPCFKKESHKYTGTLIKGIATMHKSNSVPVLNEEQATEIAKMRR